MRVTLSALFAGIVFGTGLILSGMANPAKVLAFLDLSGRWDPSLGLVMLGAILVGLGAFAQAKNLPKTLLGEPVRLPQKRDLDRHLIFGSLAFGVGWGLAGFCPGPALVATGAGEPKALVFIAAMVLGMGLYEVLGKSKG